MKKLLLYFYLAFAITWLIWLPLVLPKFGIEGLPVLPKFHHYLGSFGPLLAAVLVTFWTEGQTGVRALLGRLAKWRVGWLWFFVALIVPVLVVVAAGLADQWLNGRPFSMRGFSTNAEFPHFGPLVYFVFNLLTFGIGEETGWRGFALPVLQKRFSALTATLILTVGWAAWHIPAFFYRLNYGGMDLAGVLGFFISMLAGSVVLTWMYNSSAGSLLVVSLFHAMIELMFISENISPAMQAYEGAAIMVAAVLIVLLARPTNLSRLPRQVAE